MSEFNLSDKATIRKQRGFPSSRMNWSLLLPKDMPIYLVGDLNYSASHFNNQYLALARSPLDGSLKWVICLRDGTSRQLLHFKIDAIHCMQPISRIENGRLTFKRV